VPRLKSRGFAFSTLCGGRNDGATRPDDPE
jgi:hypothetical protein